MVVVHVTGRRWALAFARGEHESLVAQRDDFTAFPDEEMRHRLQLAPWRPVVVVVRRAEGDQAGLFELLRQERQAADSFARAAEARLGVRVVGAGKAGHYVNISSKGCEMVPIPREGRELLVESEEENVELIA